MYPPVFEVCAVSAAVKSVLGINPVRLYPFGSAPQGVAKPYAAWQVITGVPENYLSEIPDIDSLTLQLTVYADGADSARNALSALRDAIEPVAHIASWLAEGRDPETKSYTAGFIVDWWVAR